MATLKNRKKCPVCDGEVSQVWVTNQDFRVCGKCKSVWMVSDVKKSYDKEYYDRGTKGWLMKIVDRFAFWDRYLTLNLKKSDKVLEIGFGEGKFLRELYEKKYHVWGLEMSDFAKERMEKILGKKNLFGDIESIDKKFEVIVMYHVLEHIREPKDYLKKLKKILTTGGKLIVRVPNIESLEARLGGENWYHLDYPNHQILFSEAGLVKMFEDLGFKDIKSRNYFGEYRQVLGYSILSKLGIKLNKWQMIIFQIITIPILWIFSVLVVQHGVVEVEGRVDNSSSST